VSGTLGQHLRRDAVVVPAGQAAVPQLVRREVGNAGRLAGQAHRSFGAVQLVVGEDAPLGAAVLERRAGGGDVVHQPARHLHPARPPALGRPARKPEARLGHVDVAPDELRGLAGTHRRLLDRDQGQQPAAPDALEDRERLLGGRRVYLVDFDPRQLDVLVPGRIRVDAGEIEQLAERLVVLHERRGQQAAFVLVRLGVGGDPGLNVAG
jgi:hypothetical protein